MSRRFTLIEAMGRPAAPPPLDPGFNVDRRQALALLSSAMAAAVSACGKPHEEIVPYVDQPADLTPGVPQRYATALELNGYARGVTAIAVDGRPIKIEGSPKHPYSLGSTDVFAEAEVLSLYDPARARAVSNAYGPASWDALSAALFPRLEAARRSGGAGLTLFTGRIVSPTELRLIAAIQAAYPKASWRRFEPVNDDNARAGARTAFGRPLTVLPKLAECRAVLCLDADPLGPGPEQIANGRAFVAARDPSKPGFARWYAAEPAWTLTGANADHRLPLHPTLIGELARAIAADFGAAAASTSLPPDVAAFAKACAADLKANAGHAVVLVGERQPAEVHSLIHAVNAALQAPMTAIAPLDPNPDDHGASLAALAADLHAGRVETLVLLGGNPAYDAPADLRMAQAIRRAPFSVHFTTRENETSALCTWRAPLSHALESWGDARAPDGTAAIVQPLIRPLRDSRVRAEVLAMLTGASTPSAYALVRETWAAELGSPPGAAAEVASGQAATPSGQSAIAPTGSSPAGQVPGELAPVTLSDANRQLAASSPAAKQPPVLLESGTDPTEAGQATAALSGTVADAKWAQALTDGVIAGSAAAAVAPPPPTHPNVEAMPPPKSYVLVLGPDPCLFDGAHAENAWLQECPKPMTSEVWGASVQISPFDAHGLGLKDFDHVTFTANGRSVTAPVRVMPGQPDGVIAAHLGGGRTAAGPIGTGVGVDFGPLRTTAAPLVIPVTLEKAAGHGGPPSFQSMYRLEGEAEKLSPLVAVADLPRLRADPLEKTGEERPPSLLPPNPADDPHHEPAWAMVIDQAACIGCNACVVSCQAENNVPSIGPYEVARGRDMHWLRIDTYVQGGADAPVPAFQPVPCMQCEHAPCEPVCPVEASVHDHEGLNDQVYNRCIGTRFCESNCPYKVRRFNWFDYSHSQAYANLGAEAYDAQKNPDVTVRTRGVMEKCTYCVQRISAARREAEKEDRAIGPHEVTTACQAACPTQAIRFGDLNDAASGIAVQRQDPRHFALLAEAGARPRTTYLARLRNPNPALEEPGANRVASFETPLRGSSG